MSAFSQDHIGWWKNRVRELEADLADARGDNAPSALTRTLVIDWTPTDVRKAFPGPGYFSVEYRAEGGKDEYRVWTLSPAAPREESPSDR